MLADFLQESGDPRGEYIALQLAGKDEARTLELLRSHAAWWVIPLRPFINLDHCRFSRGFLDHVEIAHLEPDRLSSVLHNPVWATVRTIHLGRVESKCFKVGEYMRSLQRVTKDTDSGVRRLRLIR